MKVWEWSGLSSVLLQRAGLTPGCRNPGLPVLTGMELGPFREEAGDGVLLPLGTAEALLREEVGSVAMGVFLHETGKMKTKQTIGGQKK